MAKAKRIKAEPGDIFEVPLDAEVGYIQYLGKHKHGADVVLVLGVRAAGSGPLVLADVRIEDVYATYYPVSLALRHAMVKLVDRAPPLQEIPKVWRARGGRTKAGQILTWLIREGADQQVVTKLTNEQAKMPIEEFHSHGSLCFDLKRRFHPRQEVTSMSATDNAAPAESAHGPSALNSGKFLAVHHYLYFPTEAAAQSAYAELNQFGLPVEVRRAALGSNWLVLIHQREELTAKGVAEVRRICDELVSAHGGEYDGSEAEVAK